MDLGGAVRTLSLVYLGEYTEGYKKVASHVPLIGIGMAQVLRTMAHRRHPSMLSLTLLKSWATSYTGPTVMRGIMRIVLGLEAMMSRLHRQNQVQVWWRFEAEPEMDAKW